MKYAYVTLLSSKDYLDAVMVLALSLQKVNSKYPLIVAITKEIYTERINLLLTKIGCKIKIIEKLQYSDKVLKKYKNHSVLNTASKIQIFDFIEWDKLIYIDADSLVIQNPDKLFDKPDGSMIYNPKEKWGFSGLFVYKPKNHYEKDFYLTLMTDYEVFDGDLLGRFWFYIKDSPSHQINSKNFYDYFPSAEVESNIKIVHFINQPKPWIEPDHKNFKDCYPIAKLYKTYLKIIKEMQEKNE